MRIGHFSNGGQRGLTEETEEKCLDRQEENQRHVCARVLSGERPIPGFSADGQDPCVLTQPFLGACMEGESWEQREVGGVDEGRVKRGRVREKEQGGEKVGEGGERGREEGIEGEGGKEGGGVEEGGIM